LSWLLLFFFFFCFFFLFFFSSSPSLILLTDWIGSGKTTVEYAEGEGLVKQT
jgi:hypothetical protein